MNTLIELYDERAIENVLAADMFRPQRIIYLCPTEVAQSRERQEQIGDFFRHRGWNPELIFVEASQYKVDRILRQLLMVSEKFPDCALDVTGGSDAELFAAGLFAAKADVRIFTYSRRKNRFYNISGADFADNLPCDISYSVKDFFLMAGGTLLPGRVDNGNHVSKMFDVSKAGTYRFRSDFSIDEKNNQTVWAEFTLSSDIDENQIKTQEPVDYGVQYIRTNGYMEGAEFPNVVIIRSMDELNSYYEANKDTFDLERKDKVYSDTTIGFLDACDKYDTAYFEKGYLVFVLLEEGSGSVRHEVTGSTISSDGELGIYIKTISPEVGTCDMAEWHIILEMSNAVEVKDEGCVQVYLDNRLAYDKGAVVSQVIGTQSPHVFEEPPAAKLLHGNGSTPLLTAGRNWMYPNGDGTMAAVIVDHAHPLFCKDSLDPIYVTGDYVKLAFEDDPDSISIQCWPDTAWNSNTAESESVNSYDTAFDLKQGGYIYEITAKWNESEIEHFGSVSYYAYIIAGEEHTHQTASEPQMVDDPVSGYCGNTQTTLYINGEAYTFMYDESVTLTDILINLDYDPNKVCRCATEYTVDTEFGKGYGINLGEGYARCEKGQADLTAGQLDQIRSIIEWAKKEKPGK